jgi:hypothetical protein
MKKKHLLILILMLIIITIPSLTYSIMSFPLLPYEDPVRGTNYNAYLPALGHPTENERNDFINSIKDFAISASSSSGIPASVILGMAADESGFGFTRIAYHANNIFGIKASQYNGWQLRGQPYEEKDAPPVISGTWDHYIFDESVRKENWYRQFANRQEAINYLVSDQLLLNNKYRPARDAYRYHISIGWTYQEAAKQYCYDIAAAQYNHQGPDYYRNQIGAVMDDWDFYQYDGVSGGGGPDLQPPWVAAINVSPVSADGFYVWGNVAISVNAGDNIGVTKVEFYSNNGGYLINTDTTAPYSVNWGTVGYVPNGEQVLKVIAYDAAGNKASTSRTVYVSNTLTPVIGPVSVSPVNEDYYVWGNVTISVSASNATKVEFYSADGAYKIATDTVAPYSINWATVGYVPNGIQVLKIIAYNAAGQTATSSKTVYVANNMAPWASKIYVSPVSVDGYYVWGDVTISVEAGDPNGISDIDRVEFYSADGNYLIRTLYTAPYLINWITRGYVPDGPQTLRVVVYDKAGNSAGTARTVNVANQ